MTDFWHSLKKFVIDGFRVGGVAFFLAVLAMSAAAAQDVADAQPVKITAETLDGFGRIVLNFPHRLDLPGYKTGWDNGVLVVTFDEPISVSLPELSGSLPKYVTAARLDPDQKGLRIGLKNEFRVNKTEAGENLYIDLLPTDWVGLDPGLPREIVEELSHRARYAAEVAEQKRKARLVAETKPDVSVRIGRNPTFVRMIITWSIDVLGKYKFSENEGTLDFDWPVPIDLHELQSELPDELKSITNSVDVDGTHLRLVTADGVVPRYYDPSRREFIIDFDIVGGVSDAVDIASLLPEGTDAIRAASGEVVANPEMPSAANHEMVMDVPDPGSSVTVTPFIESVGSTVRVVFPFERDVPAAVFRRADTLWMVFDTSASIGKPTSDEKFSEIAEDFTVVPAGDTAVVRIGLSEARLATLGSEGRSWVLSLGDLVLASGEQVTLARRQTSNGLIEMTADMVRPARVHQLRDPEVGDILEVVTAYPPARGIGRDLEHVDFTALRSVHGLVVQPRHPDVSVELEGKLAVIRAERGLIVSMAQRPRASADTEEQRKSFSFLDLNALIEPDLRVFKTREDGLLQQAATAERRELDVSRLQVAEFYLANRLSYEAMGVADVLRQDLKNTEIKDTVDIVRAAAMTDANRWGDALAILNTELMANSPDALMWRTIARNGAGDYSGARRDALVAEPVMESYPHWVRTKFLLSSVEAAIETDDYALATRLAGTIETSRLDDEELGKYGLLTARIDEASGRYDEALDTYGQVISADVRPTRAEAVYRTLKLLDKMGRLDSVRAVDTLAAEAMVWRGNELEVKMMKMLAELNFRNGSYREAFEVMRSLAEAHPENPETQELFEEGKVVFANLYLNGQADAMPPVEALALYYDFRNMTPIGTRGDEMVRNLARRLIKVDLLGQAAELLQYQIDTRLEGSARAQVAADLSVIYLANRQPDKALQALHDTRLAGLPPGLDRQRRVLEARALVDSGREDLALDMLSRMDGRDADLLRIDAHWRAKRYDSAGEILERLYTPTKGQTELSGSARTNIIKAGVAYVLANDKIGSGRLRERYGALMANSPEWPLFDFITGRVQISSLEFRKIANEVAGADTLNAFLSTYSETYGVEGALSPTNSAVAADA